MKRSFLGNTEVSTAEYWSGGKGSQQLKCNETNIYAAIDLCQEQAGVADDSQELSDIYARMDKLFLCLKAVEFAGADDNALRRFGRIIGNMEREGKFDLTFANVEEENEYVDELVSEMKQRSEFLEQQTNEEFEQWFDSVVVRYNYYHNADGTKTKTMPRMGGLGATYDDDYYTKQAKNGGMALLYAVCNEKDVLDGCVDREQQKSKINGQKRTMNWLAASSTNLTLYSLECAVRAGIIADTKYKNEKQALEGLKEEAHGEVTKGVGFVISLISLIVTAISLIVTLVVNILKTKQAEHMARVAEAEAYAMNPDDIEFNAPDLPDYSALANRMDEMETEVENATQTSVKDYIPLFAMSGVSLIGIIVAAVFSRRKKRIW